MSNGGGSRGLACVLGYVFDNPMYPFYYRFIIFEFVMVISSVPCLPSPVRLGSRPLAARRARRLALGRAAREGAARGCDTWPRGVINTLHYELRRLILRSFIC